MLCWNRASRAPCSPSKTRAGPSKVSSSIPATFTTAPSSARFPAEDRDPALSGKGIRCWENHVLVGGHNNLCEVLGQGLPRHRHDIALDQPFLEQCFEDHRDTTDLVEIDHVIPAEGFEVAQMGRPPRDPVEVVEVEANTGLRWLWPAGGETALVEPPRAITVVIAFSNAGLVMI